MGINRVVAMGVALALYAAGAWAQESGSPRFDITRFVVEGNTLLKADDVERRVAPFVGKSKSFADVQHALEALQQAYQDAGYGAIQVTLPEQELEQGEVHFRVIEGRIANVKVDGNQHHDEANVRASLPALTEGQPPRSREMSEQLRVANDNPSKQTLVLLKDGANEGEIDATLRVTDDKTQKYFLSLDNSGTTQTGRFRLGVGYQNANLFNRDHVATVQYITSPENPNRVTVLGAGYRVPLYARGDSFEVYGGYSDVDSGTVQDLFTVSGSGNVLGARYNQYLHRLGENYEHKLSYALDFRSYRNRVMFLGASIIPNVTVHPASLTYSGNWRGPTGELGFYASVAQNIFPGGNAGADSDFKNSRFMATAAYRVVRYGASYTRAFGNDTQVRVVAQGQESPDALVSGEQFGAGGADSVRGFTEREVSNDRGYRGSLEIYSPDFADKVKLSTGKLRVLAFFDAAETFRNDPQPAESQGQSISGAGIGLRLSVGSNFSMRADFATAIDASDSRNSGSNIVHTSLVYIF